MLDAASAQVAEQLSDMLISQGFARFEFHDEFTLDKEIGEIVTKRCPVLVPNLQCVLLLHLHADLSQTMRQAVLINLLQMSVPQVTMQRERGFANLITQAEAFLFCFHVPFVLSAPLCGNYFLIHSSISFAMSSGVASLTMRV